MSIRAPTFYIWGSVSTLRSEVMVDLIAEAAVFCTRRRPSVFVCFSAHNASRSGGCNVFLYGVVENGHKRTCVNVFPQTQDIAILVRYC